jgi:outer membrane protein OmpA-like peptidoglycan-associated protein
MRPRHIVQIGAVLLMTVIVVLPLAAGAWMHFGSSWWDDCLMRQYRRQEQSLKQQEQSIKQEDSTSAANRPLPADKAKRTCIMIESAHAAVAAIGIFALVMLFWWHFYEVGALRHIFERPWKYLDDGDVDSVGSMRRIAYAAVFAVVLLAGAGVLFLSIADVIDPETGLIELAWDTDRTPRSDKADADERLPARLLDAALGKANNRQTRQGTDGKQVGTTDSTPLSSDRGEAHPGNSDAAADRVARMEKVLGETNAAITELRKSIDGYLLARRSPGKDGATTPTDRKSPGGAANEEGRPMSTDTGPASPTNKEALPTQTNKEASAAANRKVATTPATEQGSTSPTNNSAERVRQPANQPSTPSTGPCFTREFRTDPDQNVQRLRAESATERQRVGLPDRAAFREIADYVVFFDTAASRLSSGAEERLTQFLSSSPASNTALSIRGFADGRGSPATNERLSRDRAVEVATLVASAHRYPPIVELDWTAHGAVAPPHDRGQSDPYQRIVRVKVLQPCQ